MKIEIFTSPNCPHCPPAKEFVENFVNGKDIELIQVNILTSEGQELAQKFQIMTVPTIFISSESHQQRIGFRGIPGKDDWNKAVEMVK